MLTKKISGLLTGSINRKLIFSVALCIILPVSLLYFYIFNYFETTLISKSTQAAINSMSLIEGNLNKTLESMITTARFIAMDRNIIDALEEKGDRQSIDVRYFFGIEKLFSNIRVNYLNQYFNMTIIPENGDIIASWPRNYQDYSGFRNEKWYTGSNMLRSSFEWIAPQKQYVKNEESNEKYLVSVTINILNDTFTRSLGMILLSINESELYKQLNPGKGHMYGDLYLTDKAGIIISHRNKELIGKSINQCGFTENIFDESRNNRLFRLNGQQMLVNYLTLKKTQWKLVQVIPYNNVIAEPKQLMKQVLVISILILIVVFIMLPAFSSKITQPVRKLVRLMKKVEEGNMDVRLKSEGADEISLLGQAFNNMMQKQKELIARISEEERILVEEQKKKDRMKLEMLMAQINPHFLFNTLNTIKWTAIMGANDTVAEMVTNLGILLEGSINRGSDIITLGEEIENVKSYIYLQRIRFGNRFEAVFNIEKEHMPCRLPRFILQPLVENSIIHGLKGREFGGLVEVQVLKNGNSLEIIISDNGAGMDNERTQQLLKSLNTDENRLNGIGLANVNERIRLHFGPQYGLFIKSVVGSGTEVRIVLPYMQKKGDGYDAFLCEKQEDSLPEGV